MLKHLSVLEQSVALEGQSQASAIRDAVTLATLSESWGYRRFWVSEHHSHPSIVGTAPEVLMAAIAMNAYSSECCHSFHFKPASHSS